MSCASIQQSIAFIFWFKAFSVKSVSMFDSMPLQFGSRVRRRSVFLCSLIGVAIEICGGSDLSGIAPCGSQTGVALEICGGLDLSWVANLRSQTVVAIEICGGLDLSCIGNDRAELMDLVCQQQGLLCYPLKFLRFESGWVAKLSSQTVVAIEICGGLDLKNSPHDTENHQKIV